eukprot:193296_1
MAANMQTKAIYDSIVVDLEKLFDTTSQCEQCVAVLGTDEDTHAFRQIMTIQIRNATTLCRGLKTNFNAFNQLKHDPHLDIQTLQQSFISLHSELKDAVIQIKVKTKQYEPHNAHTNHHKSERQKPEQHEALPNALQPTPPSCPSIASVDIDELKHQDCMENDMDSNCVVNRKQILKEGWLYKKSRHLKKWRKRWIVVDKNTEDVTLFTFKHEKQYKYPTERVTINEDIQIQAKESTQNEFFLYNKTMKSKFKFKALDEENRADWIDMLLHEKDYVQEDDISDESSHQTAIAKCINMDENVMNIVVEPGACVKAFVGDVYEVDQISNNDKSEREETKEEVVSNSNNDSLGDSMNGHALYDKTNKDVQDCLVLIDDLTYLRDEEDADSENNRIISQFEQSLEESGFVTKDQMNQLRDVAIRLIGYMLDRPDSI